MTHAGELQTIGLKGGRRPVWSTPDAFISQLPGASYSPRIHSICDPMARFDIIYSAEPTSTELLSAKIFARDRTEAVKEASKRFADAQLDCGAKYYRVLDAMGMVVARGPK